MAETTTTPSILNSSSYRIPPLSGPENYLTWRIQITDILYELGLYDYVSGTKEKPKRGDTTEWDSADRRALTTIRLRISNNMMMHVLSAETSKQAFDALANVFATEGSIARITLRRKLFSYRLAEDSDLKSGIRDIKRLWIEYNLIKGKNSTALSDNDLALCILSALPPTWDGLVSAINIDSLKSSDLIGRIIQDYARRKARDDPLVYHAQERRRKFRKGITCHKCGKEGHIKPECTEPAKKDEATTAFAGAAIEDTTAPEYSF